ncbi:amidohydrolase family protein [Salinimicrobium sp. TH3]|uniref:amidohydrolase family protein n=1 Tax=Salinimicrobium sp. TH3 TaxID=2997342 RepID=UPI0022765F2E|nr:amidohydrolase family protein [Salinimicrobium sp. TH3]MCY2686007.1 amidohydrolase family protein [Salinimicrobium sp. TH3]
MKKITLLFTLMISINLCVGQVIDVHLHSYTDDIYHGGHPHPAGNIPSPPTAEAHLDRTIELMDSLNIDYAVISNSIKANEKWMEADDRFIPGYGANTEMIPVDEFEELIKNGKIKVFGEIGSSYEGVTLANPIYKPYLEICNKYGLPVMYHTGPPNPGSKSKAKRVFKGDPALIEDVIATYPDLKICLQHAGASFWENAVLLMAYYPNVYADLGVLLWVSPLTQEMAVDFLKRCKKYGILKKVMFGSDQMVWPESIKISINYLNSLDFLTEEEKRMILYENARKFLGLMD